MRRKTAPRALASDHISFCPRAPRGGSTLVVVMLVMLLVMTVALSLVLVTEVEMQLGGTERVITNNNYAAESGVHATLAGLLVTQEWGGQQFAVLDGSLGSQSIGHRVISSRVHAVGPPQVPPLTIANEGENDYHTFTVVLNSAAQRVAWPATEQSPIYEEGDPRENAVTVQAQTVQSVHYLVSPVKTPPDPRSPYNSEEITKIQF